MRNRYILACCCIIITLAMCKKGIQADKLYIRGRLFLLDTVTQKSESVALAKKKVTLAYDNADSLNYLFSDTTDQDGYFEFNLLAEKDQHYKVRYEDSVGGHYYVASQKANPGDNNIALVATLDRSKEIGFIIRLLDVAGQTIPNVSMRLYNNKALADLNDPAGAVELFSSTSSGLAFKLNIPPGTYYLNALKSVDSLNYLRISKPVLVTKPGITMDTMLLPRKTVTITNGFMITVTDSLGGVVPRATAYLYSSQVLAQTNDPGSALNSLTSDSLGIVSKYNFPAGTYYLNAFKNADTLSFRRYAKQLVITANEVLKDSVVLRKK